MKQAVDLPNSRELFPQGVGEQVTAIASFTRHREREPEWEFAETTNVAVGAHPWHIPGPSQTIPLAFPVAISLPITSSIAKRGRGRGRAATGYRKATHNHT